MLNVCGCRPYTGRSSDDSELARVLTALLFKNGYWVISGISYPVMNPEAPANGKSSDE